MKKSEKLKRKTRGLLIKNLIVFAVLIAVTVVGVRSWFMDTQEVAKAKASGLHMRCYVPEGLEVAIVEPNEIPGTDDWMPASDILLNGNNYDFLANMNMTQVTGDGISFIKPYLMQYGVVAAVDYDPNIAWDISKIGTTRNVDYLSFDLYMRSVSQDATVSLDENTYCGPVESNPAFTDGTNVLPASVVGSLRMSVTNAAADPQNESRKLLWIPAPNIYYNYDHIETISTNSQLANTSNTLALNYMNGNTLTPVYPSPYTAGTYNHTYWLSDKSHNRIEYGSDKATNVTANNKGDYKLHDTVTIATLSSPLSDLSSSYSGSSFTGYYYDKCRFNFWFEGEDPEARAAQVGGTFKSVLHLTLG